MTIIDQLGIDIYSFLPAIGAVAISLRNWLLLRQGPNIRALDIVNYGMWGIEYKDKQNKDFVFPIFLTNEGTNSGMVTDIKLFFSSKNESKELPIRQRIELNPVSAQRLKTMTIDQFRNEGMEAVNPFFPINVPSKEGVSILVECFDGEEIINIDTQMQCTIEIYYNNRITTHQFPFKVSSEQFISSKEHIKWFRP